MDPATASLIMLTLFAIGTILLIVLVDADEKANALAANNAEWSDAIDEAVGDDDEFSVESPEYVEEVIQKVRQTEYGEGFEEGIAFARNRVNCSLDQIAPEFTGTICGQCIEDASVGESTDDDDNDSLDLALEEAGQRK